MCRFLGEFAKLRKTIICFVMSVRLSVRLERLGSHWTDFHEIWYLRTFRKSVAKIRVSLKSDKNKGYFTWRLIYTLIISRSFLLRMRNVSDKSYRENQNPHFVFSNIFFENRAFYEIMWKNIVERGRPYMTIWRMRIACRIPNATNTHSGCLTLIAFPPQQWLTSGPQCYVVRTLPVLFYVSYHFKGDAHWVL